MSLLFLRASKRGVHELKVCRQQESQRAGIVTLYMRLFVSSETERAFIVLLRGSIASIEKYLLTSSVPSIFSSLYPKRVMIENCIREPFV